MLPSCEIQRSNDAEWAQTTLIGMSKEQLHMCAGFPTKTEHINGEELDTYEVTKSGSPGLSVTLPLVGGLSVSSTGNCHATFRLSDEKVIQISYAGDTSSTLGRDTECSVVVEHCLHDVPGHGKPQ
jgi:hypothetical protein